MITAERLFSNIKASDASISTIDVCHTPKRRGTYATWEDSTLRASSVAMTSLPDPLNSQSPSQGSSSTMGIPNAGQGPLLIKGGLLSQAPAERPSVRGEVAPSSASATECDPPRQHRLQFSEHRYPKRDLPVLARLWEASIAALRLLLQVPVFRHASLLLVLIATFAAVAAQTKSGVGDLHEGTLDQSTCLDRVKNLQDDPDFMVSKNNATFFRLFDGILYNGIGCNGTSCDTSNHTMLTLQGCEKLCGRQSFYWDAGPRIITWIIPVILLLSNIELSSVDKQRFLTILHAVGDPIDSLWSILHKIYIWRRLYFIGLSKSRTLEPSPGGGRKASTNSLCTNGRA